MDQGHQVSGSLPELLFADYGGELSEKIMAGYEVVRPVTLRFNTLKITAEEGKHALKEAGFSFEEVGWYSAAVILNDCTEENIRRTALYEEGKVYLQSLSSMLPPLFLSPKKGESILDMTAAPGGKTTELAALSRGEALITACERDKLRYERLLFNLKRQGAGRVTALCTDAASLDDLFCFDKILLDAPCSGSGTVSPRKNARIDALYVERCARLQEKLLRKALKLLKNGGEMVYSTCSILKRENEDVLRHVLEGCGAKVVPVEPPAGVPLLPSADGTLCVMPTAQYEGFFLAKLIKDERK